MQRTIGNNRRRRTAFSLIEMLVVIGILATLFGLAVAAVGTSLNAARVASTRATIKKVDTLLRDQFRGFQRQADIPKTAFDIETIKADARSGFPQRAIEFPSWPANNDIYDSSELLYLILTEGRVIGATPVDADAFNGNEVADTDGDGFLELVDAWGNPLRFYRWPTRLLNPFGFRSSSLNSAANSTDVSIFVADESPFQTALDVIRNTSNNGIATATLFVIVGDEIMELNSTSPNTLNVTRGQAGTTSEAHHAGATVKMAPFPEIVSLLMGSLSVRAASYDPDDPRGQLPSSSYNSVSFEGDLHTLDSYHTPLIVSAGPDEVLGLEEPFDTSNYGYLAGLDMDGGSDLSTLVAPGSSALADNITNVGGGN
ncbi:MAG: prepilin-type N-terminal cleavage/methylation domain-containing protein [Planctomycetaceae bacterium]|nr:prepilin-type N-terminal cleavage/methylation domain-containing protein [Planctomycetaceae bacterium]